MERCGHHLNFLGDNGDAFGDKLRNDSCHLYDINVKLDNDIELSKA